MSRAEIESRVAEIKAEEKKIAECEYRYGHMADRQYSAKLFQEKMQLITQLKNKSEVSRQKPRKKHR